MIFFLFTFFALAGESKILWKKDIPFHPTAVFFEPSEQKIFLSLNQGSESNLFIFNKSGSAMEDGAKVRGLVKKIFSFHSRIYVATDSEFISFDLDLDHRKKEKTLTPFFDLQLNSKGELFTAEGEGVFHWKNGEKTKISDKKIHALFFDLFELMGVDTEGTVWRLQQGKKAEFRFQKNCSSVWKYNELWICISRDTVMSSKSAKPTLELPQKLLGFGFGYQKEEKDLFWLFAFEKELRAVSPVFR
jgi:hypothetical protein